MADPKEVRPAVMFSGPEVVEAPPDRPRSPREYYETFFKTRPDPQITKANEEPTDEKKGGSSKA